MRKYLVLSTLIVSSVALLSGCSPTQISAAQTDISTGINAACNDVMAAKTQAQTLAPTNAQVASTAAYAVAACGTATAVAALVQNSDTLQWLGNLQGQLTAAPVVTPVTTIQVPNPAALPATSG